MEKHDSTPEKLKKRRFFFPLKIMRVLFVMPILFQLGNNNSVFAQTPIYKVEPGNWTFNDQNYFYYSYNVENGTYNIKVWVYGTEGADEGFVRVLNTDGTVNKDGRLDLKFNNSTAVNVNIYEEVKMETGWITSTINNYFTAFTSDPPITFKSDKADIVWWDKNELVLDANDDKTHYVYFVYRPDKINEDIAVEASGTYMYQNGAVCEWKPFTFTNLTFKPSYTISTISVDKPVFTTNIQKPAIKIHWSKSQTDGTADNYGNIQLIDAAGKIVSSMPASGKSEGDFYLDPTNGEINLNQTNQYTVKQYYVPKGNPYIHYESNEVSVTVPAFPQVTDNSFNAVFDPNTLKLNVNWEIASGNVADFDSRPFIVTRYVIKDSTTTVDNTVTIIRDTVLVNDTIAYDKNLTKYSLEVGVPEGSDYTYDFSIHRFPDSIWDTYYKRTYSLTVSTKHYSATNPEVKLSADQKTAVVTWIPAGAIWSTGTRFILTRQNLTTGASEDITLTKDNFLDSTYTDNMVQLCNEYQYKLQIFPSDLYSSIAPVYTNKIIPREIGDLKSLTASKGYYSNRVDLVWELAKGSFDVFAVNRKEYGQPDTSYKQILSVNGSSTQTTYNAEDINGVPGVVYVYQVVGSVNCADSTVASPTKPSDIGFRTPTGDIYGRVTFSNGQAVEGVEVRLETDAAITGKSYSLTGTDILTVTDTTLLKSDTTALTLQAWVKPQSVTDKGYIVRKEGMYELYIENDKLHFKAGSTTVASDSLFSKMGAPASFVHVTAVDSANQLRLYMNGKSVATPVTASTVAGNGKPVTFGNSFTGYIDEIRIWNTALSPEEILGNYNRMLTGGESGLIAYYTFNYAVDNQFFDTSFKDNNYNANHGTATSGAKTDAVNIPTTGQLGYKGVTKSDGTYAIRAIPYIGNGTSFNIIPRMGIHTFEPVQEVRFIGPGAQSHTVNFTDKSSFSVKGTVTYKGGTMPVEGVMFQIDGKTAVAANGTVFQSQADGIFEISVPVGIHEVKAIKNNHIFENDGKITDDSGQDRNYQDSIFGLKLTDITTVRFIGRVAGGGVEEAYPMGHSLSKNNLADGITVTLTSPKTGYKISDPVKKDTVEHLNTDYSTVVDYGAQTITIHPDTTTGEFVVDVIPESFSVKVSSPYLDLTKISGNGSLLNLTNSFVKERSTYSYTDSALVDGKWVTTSHNDTVYYNQLMNFNLQNQAEIKVVQVDQSGKEMEYFGMDSLRVNAVDITKSYTIPVFANGKYTFLEHPVFEQNAKYTFKVKVCERYIYKKVTEQMVQ